MKFVILLLLISCTHSVKKSEVEAQYIDLSIKTINPETHSFAYDEVLINAPNFSVDQYHPGLKDLFKKDGASLLCQPAVIANALIQDFRNNPKTKNLKLNGISSDRKTIDSNLVVRQLVQCMKFNPETGANSINGANCIANLYKSAGLKYDVILVGFYSNDYAKSLDDSVILKNRVPKIKDIISYLKDGYHVAGMIDFFKIDNEAKWKFTEGHVVSINGYARQKSWPENLIYTYIADPNFYYKASGYPRAHQFLLSKSVNTNGLPAWTSDLFLEGATMSGLYDRAFLSGLLVFRLK